LLDYFWHKPNVSNLAIAMTILVKNEADIIEANIRTHAKLGVDFFVVMDNGSTDGTREILSKLQDEFEMVIIDEKGFYQQKKFMTRLAFEAKRRFKPDWIINNDADEFWIPTNNRTLKEVLNFKSAIVRVNRFNMLPPFESFDNPEAFFNSKYEVTNQIEYRQREREDILILFGKASRKVIVNPYGLIKINSGNHSAEHIAFWSKKSIDSIRIYHYPIRSFSQFKRRVLTRREVLKNFKSVKMGDHYRDLVEKFERGLLREEYRRYLFNRDELAVLKRVGVVSENLTPSKIIVR